MYDCGNVALTDLLNAIVLTYVCRRHGWFGFRFFNVLILKLSGPRSCFVQPQEDNVKGLDLLTSWIMYSATSHKNRFARIKATEQPIWILKIISWQGITTSRIDVTVHLAEWSLHVLKSIRIRVK